MNTDKSLLNIKFIHNFLSEKAGSSTGRKQLTISEHDGSFVCN